MAKEKRVRGEPPRRHNEKESPEEIKQVHLNRGGEREREQPQGKSRENRSQKENDQEH